MPSSPWRRIPLASIPDELTVRIARLSFANLRQLDTSHGCQDHTVLPYAASSAKPSSQPVQPTKLLAKAFKRRSSAHGVRSRITALRTPLAPDAAASTATRPNVRDDGQRPSSLGRDGASCRGDLRSRRSGIFLRARLDRANQIEVAGENRALAQRRTYDFDCLQQVSSPHERSDIEKTQRLLKPAKCGPKPWSRELSALSS